MKKMYFMAIVLPPPLDEKIFSLKKWTAENYNCRVALKSPAHITIIPPFWMDEEKENELAADLEELSASTTSFIVSTGNFSAFKPATLFVAVRPNPQLNAFKKYVDDYFSERSYPIKRESRPFHPHITIATRDLHKKDFVQAWEHFGNQKFEEAFIASSISLLKHNGRNWDVNYCANFVMA
jgi:2'-5' RNA ligase